jgi:hypothetical protein
VAANRRLKAGSILAERIRRQRMTDPLPTARGLEALVRMLQPISTGAYDRPGSPPRLTHRTAFDDTRATARLRARRRLVKGRFQGGGIGYVLAEDLELYANAFCTPLARPSQIQERVLDAIQGAGPLTARQIKEETGLLNKQIMPALQRLQTAFRVCEDQLDDDWDRPWYGFETEWPRVEIREEGRGEAVREVLLRFLHGHVFATRENVRDWSRLPVRLLGDCLRELEGDGRIVACEVKGLGEGFCLRGDTERREVPLEPSLFVVHKADFLTRSRASELKRRFGSTDILQYLLIDGDLRGAIRGHWGFKPYDVEDIIVDLPAAARRARRDEILAAVAAAYPPPRHRILRYAGRAVAPPLRRW